MTFLKQIFLVVIFFNSCTQEPTVKKIIENDKPWKLICIGDGVTAGVGLNPVWAYPALLNKDYLSNGFGAVKIVNAGIKNETIQGIDQRIEWMLQQRFDAILLSLNKEKLSENTKKYWMNCFRKIRETNPEAIILVGIVNHDYAIEEITVFFSSLIKEFNVKLIDFQLSSEKGSAQLWQTNKPYLTKEGHRELADRLFNYLKTN